MYTSQVSVTIITLISLQGCSGNFILFPQNILRGITILYRHYILLTRRYLFTLSVQDVIGVELGGALKNPLASEVIQCSHLFKCKILLYNNCAN